MSDPLPMKDRPPIESIDYISADGNPYTITAGKNGIREIREVQECGEFCYIPWVEVWIWRNMQTSGEDLYYCPVEDVKQYGDKMEAQLLSEIVLRQQAERERDDEKAKRESQWHCFSEAAGRNGADSRSPEFHAQRLRQRAEKAEAALAASPALPGLRAALEAVGTLYRPAEFHTLDDARMRGVVDAEQAIQRLIDAEGKRCAKILLRSVSVRP